MRLWLGICVVAVAAVAATGAFGGSATGMAVATVQLGGCSKAEASRAPGLVAPAQVLKPLLCGPFAGGSRTIVISFAGRSQCRGMMTGWTIFCYTGDGWKSAGGHIGAVVLAAAGRDIRETVQVRLVSDLRCGSPSGYKKSRLWHWQPAPYLSFRSGPWKREP